jgi:hypothetical protein
LGLITGVCSQSDQQHSVALEQPFITILSHLKAFRWWSLSYGMRNDNEGGFLWLKRIPKYWIFLMLFFFHLSIHIVM